MFVFELKNGPLNYQQLIHHKLCKHNGTES